MATQPAVPARGWSPASRLSGIVSVPTSKSIAQRALLAGALASGRTRFGAVPDGQDVQALLTALDAAGVTVQRPAPAAVTVLGIPPGPHRGFTPEPAAPGGTTLTLPAGESGTAARFLLAAAALTGRAGTRFTIEPSGTLLTRSSPALMRALSEAGAGLEGGDGWPATVRAIGPPSQMRLVQPGSSQEVSALLLALAAWPGQHTLLVEGDIPSAPYVGLTLDVLSTFGVRVLISTDGDTRAYTLDGPLEPPLDPIRIEADASAAAVALAAGCLSGGDARVEGVGADSAQGDIAIVDYLHQAGCTARAGSTHLEASGFPARAFEADLSDHPDLAPVLAAVAAAVAREHGATSHLTGLGTLPGKESSRIEVLAHGLTALGLAVGATRETLTIGPGEDPGGELLLDGAGDHRMVFAMSLLGLVREGVQVTSASSVAKSWPGYWDDLAAAGAVEA